LWQVVSSGACLGRWLRSSRGGYPARAGRSVAVQDLRTFLVPRRGRAVAVQGEGPAPLVDDNEVVEGAEKDAVFDAGLSAAGFVPDVVDVAG
jgi:hypothetical protein